MKKTQTKGNWSLSQKEVDSIRNHLLPEKEQLKVIWDIANLGTDQLMSHVNSYWLGRLHERKEWT